MKRWISFSSHLLAGAASFLTLSVAPVVVYGAVALTRSWQSGAAGDVSSIAVVPLLSALGAGAFSVAVAPLLSLVARDCTRRFGWNLAMFPLLLGCFATFALSLANGLLGWQWSPSLVLGGGAAVGAAFAAYWVPLCWAQRCLSRLDAKGRELRERHGRRPLPVSFL